MPRPFLGAPPTPPSKICQKTTALPSPEQAHALCFGGAKGAGAERVTMGSLRAGDLVLSASNGAPVAERVIVNQHRAVERAAPLLTLHFAGGHVSLTAEHVLLIDGTLAPARLARKGSTLIDAHGKPVRVQRVSSAIGAIVNPLVTNGYILAAGSSGAAVISSTASSWSVELMTSPHASRSLSALIARLWPTAAQHYYDSLLEPIYAELAPLLTALARRLPTALALGCLALGDAVQAIGFVVYALCSLEAALALAAALLLAAGVKKTRTQAAK